MAATNRLSWIVGVTIPRTGLSCRQFSGANCRHLRLALPVALGALLQSLQELPLFIRSTPFAELVVPRNVFPKEIQPAHSSSVVGVSAIDATSLAGLSLWNDGWNDGMTHGARNL
jgi:hypothetical protein